MTNGAGSKMYFADVTYWCRAEFNQRWMWVLQTRKDPTLQIYLPSTSPQAHVQFSLCVQGDGATDGSRDPETKAWGWGQDGLDSVSIPVTWHPHLRVRVCFSLQCHVQMESWISRGVLEIKEEKGHRVCGCFIPRNSLNVARPPVTKMEHFFAQSISSITDILPNYGPFATLR